MATEGKQAHDFTHTMTTSRIRLFLPTLLLAAGIAVGGHFIGKGIADRNNVGRTIYQLNEIKPGTIQEATHNARIAAAQFSRDSQSALGKLRRASQGLFQIEDRDAATAERKIVRVVVKTDGTGWRGLTDRDLLFRRGWGVLDQV